MDCDMCCLRYMRLRYQYKLLDAGVNQMVDGQSRYRIGEGQAICDKAAMRWCNDAIAISHRRNSIGETNRGK